MSTIPPRQVETRAGDGLRYEQVGRLPVYRFEQLSHDPDLVYAVFTRQGGVSLPPYASLNLGRTVGDDLTAVEANHERVCGALGLRRSDMITCHLTHSADVLVVSAADKGQVVGRADAIVTAASGVYLNMRFGDCVPILLHDPVRRAVGLAHAGWRGTLKNVAGAAVGAMVDDLGCSPEAVTAVIGPAIGRCCYQVGEEVIRAVEATNVAGDSPSQGDGSLLSGRNGRHAYFDLWEANRRQLMAAGVSRVVVAGICTACRTDQFFSHRAERGETGRFGVVIGYRE